MELYYLVHLLSTYLCTAALVFAFLVSCNNCYSIRPDYLYTKEREKARLATEPCTRRLALHALLILGLAGRCVLHLFTQKNETCFDDFTLHSCSFIHSTIIRCICCMCVYNKYRQTILFPQSPAKLIHFNRHPGNELHIILT